MDFVFIVIAIILFLAMLLYFRIADKHNIIDKPNQRSSHTSITLRGGGIIFPIAVLLYYLFYQTVPFSAQYLLLALSIWAVSIVSFYDDVSSLPNKIRITVHLLSVSVLLFAVHAFTLLPIWAILLCYILIIGTLNAYNFMDGINGITGLYSLAILISCLFFNEQIQPVLDSSYIITPIIACLVFLFFNFRKKAKCFAGDVGSISIGFWIISILLLIILDTGELKYIFFLAVYGVDSVLTIIHRLLLKQNIFEAHRMHFYQVLANEKKVSHLVVATIYGALQVVINFFIIKTDFHFTATGILVCLPLAVGYVFFKSRFINLRTLQVKK